MIKTQKIYFGYSDKTLYWVSGGSKGKKLVVTRNPHLAPDVSFEIFPAGWWRKLAAQIDDGIYDEI